MAAGLGLAAPAWAMENGDGISCLIEPNTRVAVGSPIPGLIRSIAVERGDRVEKGQVLLQLENGVEQAAVELAAARVEFGRRKVARNNELYAKELLSAQERDEMETEVKVSVLELREAKEKLKLKTIASPISGIVVERTHAPGELIGEDHVLTLVSIDPLHVELIVPASEFGRVAQGMTATVRPRVVGGSYVAEVAIVDPVIDAKSQTFGVRLLLDNPDHRLPAGLECDVAFE